MRAIEIRQSEKFPEPEFSRLQRIVFSDVQQPSEALALALQDEKRISISKDHSHSPIFRLGAYLGNELIGWSCGWMERGDVFYMGNSGVVAAHRRQGVYSSLLKAIRENAVHEGAVAVRSQHCVINNAVIIAKLRAGFTISGLSQSAQMGTLVEMTLHLSAKRAELYRTRALPFVTPASD